MARTRLAAALALTLTACSGAPAPTPEAGGTAEAPAAPAAGPAAPAPAAPTAARATRPLPGPKPPPPQPAEPCDDDDDECRVQRVGDMAIGWLRSGLDRATVIAQLGPPAEVEKPWEEGASGDWVADHHWPAAGVRVTFAADTADGPQSVRGVTVRAPFDGKTNRGVGIGSTEAEVRAAYAGTFDPRSNGLIAGSVYGGIFFTFDDAKKVSEIFVGAGAE